MEAETQEVQWDETQQEAIRRCCDMNARIVPVTGVAGTGKTSIMKEVYHKLTNAGYTVTLCAPTGKAAKRIQEATGIPAMTMHRLLEYPYPGERDEKTGEALMPGDPRRDKRNPLDYQVILADEYAMVNRELHRNLIDALPSGGRVCMFGDVNQLTPIEKGANADRPSPFIVALGKFEGVKLERIHRTREGSGVSDAGARIMKGYMPLRNDDFSIINTDQPVRALETYVMDMMSKGVNFAKNDGQIITPTRQTWIGTYKLNLAMQNLLNPMPQKARLKLARNKWEEKNPVWVAVGDKVIWTQNAYDMRNVWDRFEEVGYHPDGSPIQRFIPPLATEAIMNGESGIITQITDNEHGQTVIVIDVGDREVRVPETIEVESKRGIATVNLFTNIDLGYVITTHKAQGSEWPHVIYVLNKSTQFMHSRPNIYTAITRASEHVTIIADIRSLQQSVTRKNSHSEMKARKERDKK